MTTNHSVPAVPGEAGNFDSAQQVQRVQVEQEFHPAGKHVKIRLESFDECLGWYTAGSLSLPLHQLPLLEEALSQLRKCGPKDSDSGEKVIPFPGL